MGNWIAREPWASLRYAHGYFRLAFQAGRLFGGCLPTNLTQTHDRAQVEVLADIAQTSGTRKSVRKRSRSAVTLSFWRWCARKESRASRSYDDTSPDLFPDSPVDPRGSLRGSRNNGMPQGKPQSRAESANRTFEMGGSAASGPSPRLAGPLRGIRSSGFPEDVPGALPGDGPRLPVSFSHS